MGLVSNEAFIYASTGKLFRSELPTTSREASWLRRLKKIGGVVAKNATEIVGPRDNIVDI